MSKHTGRTFRGVLTALCKASEGAKVIYVTNYGNEAAVIASISKMAKSFLSPDFMTKSIRGEPPVTKFMMASGGTIEIESEATTFDENTMATRDFVVDVNDGE